MSEPISHMAKAAIEAFLTGIDDFNEDEAAHFFKELAQRSTPRNCQIFIDAAKKKEEINEIEERLKGAKKTYDYLKAIKEEYRTPVQNAFIREIEFEMSRLPKVDIPNNCLIPAEMDKKYDVEVTHRNV